MSENVWSNLPREMTVNETCAICFEAGPFVQNPCACTVSYCVRCWDHALAASVASRGDAQCPSCRAPFSIDYDTEARTLTYVPYDPEEADDELEWQVELCEKVKPLQIRLLQDFGMDQCAESHHSCSSSRGHGGPDDGGRKHRSALAYSEGFPTGPRVGPDYKFPAMVQDPDAIPTEANPIANNRHQPRCMCGTALIQVDRMSRVLRMLDDNVPDWRERVVHSKGFVESWASFVVCSLCNKPATRTGFSWTCPRGANTMWHHKNNDICERCFEYYVGSRPASQPENKFMFHGPHRFKFPKQSPILCRGGISHVPWRHTKPFLDVSEATSEFD